MKKVISTSAMALLVATGAFAQMAQLKITSREADIPLSIVETFKQDFKDTSGQWAVVPAKLTGEEYRVSGFNLLNGQQPASYKVIIRGNGINGKASYNRDGKLVFLKEHISNTAIPPVVTNALLTQYPGYAFVKDQETLMQGKSKVVQYKIIIQKDNNRKLVAVNSDGKIVKERSQHVRA